MKQLKITEDNLKTIIAESIKKVLTENDINTHGTLNTSNTINVGNLIKITNYAIAYIK